MNVRRSHGLYAVAVLAAALLLRGETPTVDPRFESPTATVRTFWQALALGPADEVLECFVDVGVGHDATQMLGLPPLEYVHLRNVRVEARGPQRAIVRYEIWYQVAGTEEGNSFDAGDELVRVRGQWRIHRPLAATSKSGAPRKVDRGYAPMLRPTPDFAGVVVDPCETPC